MAKFRIISPGRNENGFALLIVLWSMVLIGFLTTQILASGRTALLLARNACAAAAARADADGAISETLFHVLSYGPGQWPANGTLHLLREGNVTISARVQSLAGKINPNLASTGLLAGLFQADGAAPGQARQLADAIIAWRSPAVSRQQTQAALAAYQRAGLPYGPPGHGFADLHELAGVIGMPHALLAAALPDLSLYQPGDPDPTLADPQVRRALALAGQAGSNSREYEGTFPVVSIEAEVAGPGHLILSRTAIVSIPGADGPEPFRFLSITGD